MVITDQLFVSHRRYRSHCLYDLHRPKHLASTCNLVTDTREWHLLRVARHENVRRLIIIVVRLRACTRIRFQKDPFWFVHTYRTSIRRPRSHVHGPGLILGNVPPPEKHGLWVLHICWQRPTRFQLKSHFFCSLPLLASVVLLYCLTCLCLEEGVYVVC